MIEAENDQDLEAWMEHLEEVGCVTHGPDGLFGVPLEEIQAVNTKGIPLVVTGCMAAVEASGMDTVGIYRLSSTKTKIDELRILLAAGKYDQLQNVEVWDINTVSCLFKQWLRELPDPLCTFKLYQPFTELGPAPTLSKVKELVSKIPHNNRVVLRLVLEHLRRVAAHSSANNMTVKNLASIFGPTLVRPQADLDFRIDRQIFAVEFLINHVEELF